MFNFPDELNACNKFLETINNDVLAITKLWNHIKVC